jgi:hypothetical protein
MNSDTLTEMKEKCYKIKEETELNFGTGFPA